MESHTPISAAIATITLTDITPRAMFTMDSLRQALGTSVRLFAQSSDASEKSL
jgi:hypothetical protein